MEEDYIEMDDNMTYDAYWVIDLFQIQLSKLQMAMRNRRTYRDKFDKYSYSAWAITETFICIDETSNYQYITVGSIREILKMQLWDYRKYYENNPERNIRYKYAAEMIQNLLDITGGYLND